MQSDSATLHKPGSTRSHAIKFDFNGFKIFTQLLHAIICIYPFSVNSRQLKLKRKTAQGLNKTYRCPEAWSRYSDWDWKPFVWHYYIKTLRVTEHL
jgi:hypothetical protein